MLQSGTLNDLGYERHSSLENPHDLPSWMPSLEFQNMDLALDYSVALDTANSRLSPQSQAGSWSMSGTERLALVTGAHTVLVVSGYRLSLVNFRYETIPSDMLRSWEDVLKMINAIKGTVRGIIAAASYEHGITSVDEATVKFLTAERGTADEEETARSLSAMGDIAWCAQHPDATAAAAAGTNAIEHSRRAASAEAFRLLIVRALMDRRLFGTEDSRFCLKPETVEEGDQVVLLH